MREERGQQEERAQSERLERQAAVEELQRLQSEIEQRQARERELESALSQQREQREERERGLERVREEREQEQQRAQSEADERRARERELESALSQEREQREERERELESMREERERTGMLSRRSLESLARMSQSMGEAASVSAYLRSMMETAPPSLHSSDSAQHELPSSTMRRSLSHSRIDRAAGQQRAVLFPILVSPSAGATQRDEQPQVSSTVHAAAEDHSSLPPSHLREPSQPVNIGGGRRRHSSSPQESSSLPLSSINEEHSTQPPSFVSGIPFDGDESLVTLGATRERGRRERESEREAERTNEVESSSTRRRRGKKDKKKMNDFSFTL